MQLEILLKPIWRKFTHFCHHTYICDCYLQQLNNEINKGQSWSWSHGRWIYLRIECLSPLTLWAWISLRRGVLDKVISDFRQVSAFHGTPASSTNKTGLHDINWNIVESGVYIITLTLTRNEKWKIIKIIKHTYDRDVWFISIDKFWTGF